MKKLIYAPAAVFATIVLFVCESLIIIFDAGAQAAADIFSLCAKLPKDFIAAYDEFLESR